MFSKRRDKVIILFDNVTAIVFKAKYEAKNRKLLKLLIPKITNSTCTSKSR